MLYGVQYTAVFSVCKGGEEEPPQQVRGYRKDHGRLGVEHRGWPRAEKGEKE
jgi:hypothetical protein